MTLKEAERRLNEAKEARSKIGKKLSGITNESAAEIDALNRKFDDADLRLNGAQRDYDIASAAKASPQAGVSVRVGKEAKTYEKGDKRRSYFVDLYHAQKYNDGAAVERLRANDREYAVEVRESGTEQTTGFLPPIWMADEWAEFARPGRPVADRMRTTEMPEDGLTAHMPKVSTGLTVAAQGKTAGVNDDVEDTDITSTTVDADLVTIAGQTDVDRQVLERSLPGLDMVLFDDLLRAYDAELDRQILNGETASDQHLGILNVSGVNAVTDNSGTTQADLLNDVYKAISKIYSLRFLPPTAIYMHPRRAAWLASAQESSFPIFQQDGLFHAVGQQDNGIVGSMAGLPVIADANIPTNLGTGTNQDAVVVSYEPDFRLAEGDVKQATYQEVLSSSLAVRLQLYSFGFFFPHRFPQGISVISGSLLAAPSGF